MRLILSIHTFFSAIVAGILLVRPVLLYKAAVDIQSISLARGIGFADLAMCFLGFFLLRVRSSRDVVGVGLTTLSVFHVGFAFSQFFLAVSGLLPFPLVAAHGILGVFFMFFLIRTIRV